MRKLNITRAIISVYDKTGIFELADFLNAKEITIISSGGTAEHLEQNGIKVENISDYTCFPEILKGRVKTLHPKIYAGILCDKEDNEHLNDLVENDIAPIELVVVNLYPFEEKSRIIDSIEELIEYIDIGGVSLIRAGAKNYKNCLVLTTPNEYDNFIKIYNENNGVPLDYLKKNALSAFRYSAYYDSLISEVLENKFELINNEYFNVPLKISSGLRYGENPHQKANLYMDPIYKGNSIFNYRQVQGKELSFNNILDMDVAIRINDNFKEPNCVVIKHNNPCGFAIGQAGLQNFENAWNSDSLSAFGSIIGINYTLTKEIAENAFKKFVEVIICREAEPEALEILKKKKNLRILVKRNLEKRTRNELDLRKIKGGLLVQDEDLLEELTDDLRLVTETKFRGDHLNDIFYGLKLIKYFKSNSVILIKDGVLVGAGFGQPNRVECVKMAIEKAADRIKNSIVISDAFFPFRDSIDLLADKGIAGIVQPGGSLRDDDVITACNENRMPMFFTGIRHFKH